MQRDTSIFGAWRRQDFEKENFATLGTEVHAKQIESQSDFDLLVKLSPDISTEEYYKNISYACQVDCKQYGAVSTFGISR